MMIAYSFPPEGSAGVYRPLRFARHLTHRGWKVSTISAEKISYERYDPDLLTLVPDETKVFRVRSCDPWQALQAKRGRLQAHLANDPKKTERIRAAQQAPLRFRVRSVVRVLEAWCYHPDMAMPWIRPAVRASVENFKCRRPDVIWATAGPVSSFIVAQRTSRHTGVPYVLDFRDAWTLTYNEFEALRPRWARRADRNRMYRMLKGAQAVVFLYDTMAECFWRAYPGALEAAKIHVIPNGFEGVIEDCVAARGEKCTIIYTGTLSSYRYDTLLTALQDFKRINPTRAKQLHFLFVGEGMDAITSEAAALGLADIITGRGAISSADIRELQRNAHALLILGRGPEVTGYELFAGAKLFGYLQAGQPIFGVLPQDETQKILRRVGVSTVADANRPAEIVAVLEQLLDCWSAGTLASLVPDRNACELYSVEQQTTKLIRALEGSPALEPFVPGSVEVPPSLQNEIRDRVQLLAGRAYQETHAT